VVLVIIDDTPHELKPGGFLGQPTQWRAYAPTDLSSPVQDGDCGMMIAIE
jgi:hypothetical protein